MSRTVFIATVLLVVILAIICSVADAGKYDNVDRLQVGVKYRPETCERKTKTGDRIRVHYTGTLTDGTEFDSSRKRNDPFTFTLGAGQVIKGWDQGLLGACVGEKRKLVIPAHLGYGDRGTGRIPGGATLIFETEIVGIDN
eukprot:GEZU01035749.1.p2 GENE.GEZU01035749.1~~GEZU01035749.1.p2  ORF type:complete len:141 (+),score=39.87 GEZU01035749.1:60-482(+)